MVMLIYLKLIFHFVNLKNSHFYYLSGSHNLDPPLTGQTESREVLQNRLWFTTYHLPSSHKGGISLSFPGLVTPPLLPITMTRGLDFSNAHIGKRPFPSYLLFLVYIGFRRFSVKCRLQTSPKAHCPR